VRKVCGRLTDTKTLQFTDRDANYTGGCDPIISSSRKELRHLFNARLLEATRELLSNGVLFSQAFQRYDRSSDVQTDGQITLVAIGAIASSDAAA